MRSKISFIFPLLISSGLLAQQANSKIKFRESKFIVKVSPIQIFCCDFPTFQVAIEYQFSKHYAFQFEAGPSFLNQKLDPTYFTNQSGYKVKLEFRKYILIPSKRWRIYYGPELYYNHINYRKTDLFGVNCVDGLCDQFERKEYGMQYREGGLHFKSGAMFKVYRFCMDIHFGFAIRDIRYKEIDKPPEVMYQGGDGDFLSFDTLEKSRIGFSPTAGIRFGYILK